jgi:outer membrane protein assembly factor BamB
MSYAVSRPAYSSLIASTEPQLRLWPGLLFVLCQWLIILLPTFIDLQPFLQFMSKFYGPMLGALSVLVWWLFASRARWFDRLLMPVLYALIAAATYFLVDPSFRPMPVPMPLIMYGLPVVTTAGVVWLAVGAGLSWPVRRIGLILVFLLAWGACTAVRFDGVDGAFKSDMNFRWTPTAEQKFLAERATQQPDASPETLTDKLPQVAEWPGFRGADGLARLTGFRLDTDWSTPPRELWRSRVGPAWS